MISLRFQDTAVIVFVWVLGSILAGFVSGCSSRKTCVEYERIAKSELPVGIQDKLDYTMTHISMHDSLTAVGAQILVRQGDYEGGPRKKIVLNGQTREFKYITSVMDVRPKSFDVLTGPRMMEDIGPLSFLPGAQTSRFLTLSRQDLSIEREVAICGHMRGVVRGGEYVYVRTYNDADEVEYGRVRLPQQ